MKNMAQRLMEKLVTLVSTFVDSERGCELHQRESTTLSDLVAGFNKLDIYPRDIINI
jgi:hypothetical protein